MLFCHTDTHIAKYMPHIFRSYSSARSNALQCLLRNDIASSTVAQTLKTGLCLMEVFQVNTAPLLSTFSHNPTSSLHHSTTL